MATSSYLTPIYSRSQTNVAVSLRYFKDEPIFKLSTPPSTYSLSTVHPSLAFESKYVGGYLKCAVGRYLAGVGHKASERRRVSSTSAERNIGPS
ncbi:hypothetical protein TNCV_4092851 [Trichonephila clavipes]|nr:hypothetical protein TNCV_4092851 [Trichonephila clavipes]